MRSASIRGEAHIRVGGYAMEPDKEHSLLSNSRCRTSLLGPTEPRAQVDTLSPAKREALIACLESGALHRHCGGWVPATSDHRRRRISGVTVANLARDGMLTIEARATARLTSRGSWFARTAADDLVVSGGAHLRSSQ
jgi:hypothetical protein